MPKAPCRSFLALFSIYIQVPFVSKDLQAYVVTLNCSQCKCLDICLALFATDLESNCLVHGKYTLIVDDTFDRLRKQWSEGHDLSSCISVKKSQGEHVIGHIMAKYCFMLQDSKSIMLNYYVPLRPFCNNQPRRVFIVILILQYFDVMKSKIVKSPNVVSV